ncbi:MAG TPA: type II secretion system protein GspJ [Methylomirabilota bacterium]|nr:type II secretion system protein GspJ [Methylomirabilota bacterium]
MPGRGARGFTLLELMIALGIVGALLVIAFGGLRVALAAWTRGEDRAEVHQHLRGVTMVLSRSVGAAYPYRASAGDAPDPVLLFRGSADRLELVTRAVPFPAAAPVAFTALVLSIERGEEGEELVVRQRPLPNRNPFTEAEVVLRDPSIQTLALHYLDAAGSWQEEWDAEEQGGLPSAVRIALAIRRGDRTEAQPPLTVSLRTVTP